MFAFSQMQPRTTGVIDKPQVPLSRYLSENFQQGYEDSAFKSVMDITEMELADPDSPSLLQAPFMSLNEMAAKDKKISPEEANNKYQLPGLVFDQPINEERARLIHERRAAELNRSYYLNEGDTSPSRWVGGMGVRMAGGMMNPLDLGVNFLPVVGSEAEAANVLGRGGRMAGLRSTLAGGLIPKEAIKLPAAEFIGSMINGAVGQSFFEAPHAIAKMQNMEEYDVTDFLTSMAQGAAFAGIMHAGIKAAGHIWKMLTPDTRVVMLKQAIDNIAKGEDIKVHDYVKLDENVNREQAHWDPENVRNEAEYYAELMTPGIKEKLSREFRNEYIKAAAIRLPDGEIHTGPIHPLILENLEAQGKLPSTGEIGDGFVTNTGRFISRTEASKLVGSNESMAMLNLKPDEFAADAEMGAMAHKTWDEYQPRISQPNWVYQHAFESLKAGKEAPNVSPELIEAFKEGKIKSWTALKMMAEGRNAALTIEGTPEYQRILKTKQNEAAQEFIAKKRQEFQQTQTTTPDEKAEIIKQINDGKILTPEIAKKYDVPELLNTAAESNIKEDIATLQADLNEKPREMLDMTKAIEAAAQCIIENGS